MEGWRKGKILFFFLIFFLRWTIFKLFIEFVTILLLFYGVCFFWPQGTWLLASWVGMEPTLLGRQILNHWRIREVLRRGFLSEEEDEKRRRQKRVSGTGSGEGRIRAAISRPRNFPLAGFWCSPQMSSPSPVLTQLDPNSPRFEAQLLPPPA